MNTNEAIYKILGLSKKSIDLVEDTALRVTGRADVGSEVVLAVLISHLVSHLSERVDALEVEVARSRRKVDDSGHN